MGIDPEAAWPPEQPEAELFSRVDTAKNNKPKPTARMIRAENFHRQHFQPAPNRTVHRQCSFRFVRFNPRQQPEALPGCTFAHTTSRESIGRSRYFVQSRGVKKPPFFSFYVSLISFISNLRSLGKTVQLYRDSGDSPKIPFHTVGLPAKSRHGHAAANRRQ